MSREKRPCADVAQLAEHLICNQAVASSILAVSSGLSAHSWRSVPAAGIGGGGVPKRPTGADCKSAGESLRRFESFPHHLGDVIRKLQSASPARMNSAGVAQLVERKPSKLDVAGSSPVSRSWRQFEVLGAGMLGACFCARVAQLVEHTLGKGEVIGSIPIASFEMVSRRTARALGWSGGAGWGRRHDGGAGHSTRSGQSNGQSQI